MTKLNDEQMTLLLCTSASATDVERAVVELYRFLGHLINNLEVMNSTQYQLGFRKWAPCLRNDAASLKKILDGIGDDKSVVGDALSKLLGGLMALQRSIKQELNKELELEEEIL